MSVWWRANGLSFDSRYLELPTWRDLPLLGSTVSDCRGLSPGSSIRRVPRLQSLDVITFASVGEAHDDRSRLSGPIALTIYMMLLPDFSSLLIATICLPRRPPPRRKQRTRTGHVPYSCSRYRGWILFIHMLRNRYITSARLVRYAGFARAGILVGDGKTYNPSQRHHCEKVIRGRHRSPTPLQRS